MDLIAALAASRAAGHAPKDRFRRAVTVDRLGNAVGRIPVKRQRRGSAPSRASLDPHRLTRPEQGRPVFRSGTCLRPGEMFTCPHGRVTGAARLSTPSPRQHRSAARDADGPRFHAHLRAHGREAGSPRRRVLIWGNLCRPFLRGDANFSARLFSRCPHFPRKSFMDRPESCTYPIFYTHNQLISYPRTHIP
jgi:hypothetical protein